MKAHAFCMSVTPFATNGEIDETAFRAHLRRMVAAGVGVYLASPGSGEGHALSYDELKKVYEIGVAECKGKIPVFANSPEARTAQQMIERVRIAMNAGVDMVQIYPVDGGHGAKPTDEELERYYRDILDEIDYPVGLSVHPISAGYVTPIRIVKTLLSDYRQLIGATVMIDSTYMMALMDAVGPRIAYYNSARTLSDGIIMGTNGALMGHPNIAPRLCQSVFDSYHSGNIELFQSNYKDLLRLFEITSRYSANPHWLKAGMQYMDAPGHGEGRVRRPYVAWSTQKADAYKKELEAMKLREIENA